MTEIQSDSLPVTTSISGQSEDVLILKAPDPSESELSRDETIRLSFDRQIKHSIIVEEMYKTFEIPPPSQETLTEDEHQQIAAAINKLVDVEEKEAAQEEVWHPSKNKTLEDVTIASKMEKSQARIDEEKQDFVTMTDEDHHSELTTENIIEQREKTGEERIKEPQLEEEGISRRSEVTKKSRSVAKSRNQQKSVMKAKDKRLSATDISSNPNLEKLYQVDLDNVLTFGDIFALPAGIEAPSTVDQTKKKKSSKQKSIRGAEGTPTSRGSQTTLVTISLPQVLDEEAKLKGTGSDIELEGEVFIVNDDRSSLDMFEVDTQCAGGERLSTMKPCETVSIVGKSQDERPGEEKISMESQEEELEHEEEQKEEEEMIDREALCRKHYRLVKSGFIFSFQNIWLQKAMVKYYRKKKMEHVMKPVDRPEEDELKYKRRIDALNQLRDIKTLETQRNNEEITKLQTQETEKRDEVEKLFSKLLAKETYTGTGLIYTKTGKVISEKSLHTLLERQKKQCEVLSEIRLDYIKIRNRLTEVQNKIKSVNQICQNENLNEYTQLKMLNRGFHDKFEEKEVDLAKFKVRYQATMHKLTDLRERYCVNCKDILVLRRTSFLLDEDVLSTRHKINALKRHRDRFRRAYMRNEQDSGLLLQPILLRDFEASLELQKHKQQELHELTKAVERSSKQIIGLRGNIEDAKMAKKRISTRKRVVPQYLWVVGEVDGVYK